MPENNDNNKEKKNFLQIIFSPLIELFTGPEDAFASKVDQKKDVVDQEEAAKNTQEESTVYADIDQKKTLKIRNPEEPATKLGKVTQDDAFVDNEEDLKYVTIYSTGQKEGATLDDGVNDYEKESMSDYDIYSNGYKNDASKIDSTSASPSTFPEVSDTIEKSDYDNVEISNDNVKNSLSIFDKIKNFFIGIKNDILNKIKILISGDAEQFSPKDDKSNYEISEGEDKSIYEVVGSEDKSIYEVVGSEDKSMHHVPIKNDQSQSKASDLNANEISKQNLSSPSDVYAKISRIRNVAVVEDGKIIDKNGSEYSSIEQFAKEIVADKSANKLLATSKGGRNDYVNVKIDSQNTPPVKPPRVLNPPKNYTSSDNQVINVSSVAESKLQDTINSMNKKSFEGIIDASHQNSSSKQIEDNSKADPNSLSFAEKLKTFEAKAPKEGGSKSKDGMSR